MFVYLLFVDAKLLIDSGLLYFGQGVFLMYQLFSSRAGNHTDKHCNAHQTGDLVLFVQTGTSIFLSQ